MERSFLIEHASSLGDHLCELALWQENQCTWIVQVSDPEAQGDLKCKQVRAGGGLYQGTAGIAWFLGELAGLTGNAEQRRTALGALDHSLAGAAELPPGAFGFHSGRTGAAWAAARLARVLDVPSYREAAWRILEPLLGNEEQDQGIDVIAGAAGAIPALLTLARTLEREELLESAARLGDVLIARAQQEPGGWSWRTMTDVVVRNLCGLAHGASGFGLALLELAAATGEGRYRFAGEMAFLYERPFFDPKVRNWPDFRNQELADFQFYGQQETLRKLAAAGKAPAYHFHCMAAWCHGSPGAGLARLRAYELTGQDLYREEALAGLPSTLAALQERALRLGNYSLCHGHFGNCELPLYGARLLDLPELLEPCEQAITVGVEVAESRGFWPSGTLTREGDPSLMLGDAGVGSFLLRMAEPEIPTPVLLRPQVESPQVESPESADDEGFLSLAQESAEGYFRSTLESLKRLGEDSPSFLAEIDTRPLRIAPPQAAFGALQEHLAETPPSRRELLEDLFLLESSRYQAALRLTDFSQEFLRQITRPPWTKVDPYQARFVLPDGSQLVTTDHDWQAWLQSEGASETPPEETVSPPEEDEAYYLLYRHQNQIVVRVVGPFAALILEGLTEASTLQEIVARVAEALDAQDVGDAVLIAKILPQLQQLYEADLVDEASHESDPEPPAQRMAVAEAE